MANRADVLRTRIDLDNKDANKAADQHAKKIESTGKRTQKSMDKTGGAAKNLKASLLKIGVGVAAITAAFVAIDKLADRADKVTNLGRGFETLSNRIETTSSVFLPMMRRATRGLVDDMELMRQANNAVILGVAQSDKEFAKLMNTALKLGRAMGVGPTRALDSLVTGIGRQSRLMLDNVGIVVRVADAYEAYAEEMGVAVDMLTDLDKKQAFYNATMLAAEDASQNLSVTTGTLSENWKMMTIDIVNATNALLKWINNVPVADKEMDAHSQRMRESLRLTPGPYGLLLKFLQDLDPAASGAVGSINIADIVKTQELDANVAASKARLDELRGAVVDLPREAVIDVSVREIGGLMERQVPLEAIGTPNLEPIKSEFHDLSLIVNDAFTPDSEAAMIALTQLGQGMTDMEWERITAMQEAKSQVAWDLNDLQLQAAQEGSQEQMDLLLQRNQMEMEAEISHWKLKQQLEIATAEETQAAIDAIKAAAAKRAVELTRWEMQQAMGNAAMMVRAIGGFIAARAEDDKRAARLRVIVGTAANIIEAWPNYYAMAAAAIMGATQLSAVNSSSFSGGGSIGATSAPDLRPGQGSGLVRRDERPVEVHVFMENTGVIQDVDDFARQMGDTIQNQMNRGGAN